MTTQDTNHSLSAQQQLKNPRRTYNYLSHTSIPSPSSPSSQSPSSSSTPFFQTSRPSSTSTPSSALHSTFTRRTPGPSPTSPDSVPSTISTFDFSLPSSSLSDSTPYFPSSTPSSSTTTAPTTPSSFTPRRLSFQHPEQVHPLSLPKKPTMISTATASHPPSLTMPSPMPSSPLSASPSSLSASTSLHTFDSSQNQNSRPLVATSSLSSHCPPMLPRPKSHSSDPIPGAFLLTPNNSLNPHTAHLSSVAMNMSRRPSLPVNHPLLHHHHPMERQRSYDPRRQPPGFYLQQQALLQEQFEQQQQQQRRLSQADLPPMPVLLQRQEAALPQQRPALTPLPPSQSMSSLTSTCTMVPSLSSRSISSTLSSSTLATISTAARHPLWQLDCRSCKTTLCEQAMLGHLAGDSDKKLFSTNLAVGVLGLPDRPVFIQCPCKFHHFACASCGSVCGYRLEQTCAGCKTDRGNGHFWIFYANEVVSHWRRIRDGNYTVTTAAITTAASTSEATTLNEKETTPTAAFIKGESEGLGPQLITVSMSRFEQSENVTHPMDKQARGGGAIGEVDVALAKCHLARVECEGGDEAEGRPMYWDDLPTWQSQIEGNVGR